MATAVEGGGPTLPLWGRDGGDVRVLCVLVRGWWVWRTVWSVVLEGGVTSVVLELVGCLVLLPELQPAPLSWASWHASWPRWEEEGGGSIATTTSFLRFLSFSAVEI